MGTREASRLPNVRRGRVPAARTSMARPTVALRGIHGFGEATGATEKVDPGRGIDQDHRRVFAKSNVNFTLPRNFLSAEPLDCCSSASSASTSVAVVPFPVSCRARVSASMGRSSGELPREPLSRCFEPDAM